jgi:hypothetical protein
MVESAHALRKYIESKSKVFTPEEQVDTSFLFNLETSNAMAIMPELCGLASQNRAIQGLAFGRVDFSASSGLSRDDINGPQVTAACLATAKTCLERGLDFVVGGGVSMDSLDVLKQLRTVHLSRFETRKVIFDGDAASRPEIQRGLTQAVHFELLWLLNKRDYYGVIQNEDARRIEMLEQRHHVLNT